MNKELLFVVTAEDCDWSYMRGTGPGGQKRNKTETKVRCLHRASGAVGESDETRSQPQNKRLAFRKMAESDKFKKWHKIETSRRLGTLINIEEEVEKQMNPINIRTEKKENGLWKEVKNEEIHLLSNADDVVPSGSL